MAFGERVGPQASAKQVQELLHLLKVAGHSDFRDARGPMGFNQRQAGGKFSRDEATALIERLHDINDTTPAAPVVPAPSRSTEERALRSMPAEQLAAELRRRGWTVVQP